ncbi:MAG: NAD(P)H-binding protein, partial [Desulfuromonadales bacterium]
MEKSQGSILITGATGFIGRRLTQRLLDEGYSVRCMVRHASAGLTAGAETVQGDMLEPATLGSALADIDTAYYLVHSMSGGRAGFERRDRDAAENFVAAANWAKVRRVIYLGGLGETGDDLSEHLKSRLEVAE